MVLASLLAAYAAALVSLAGHLTFWLDEVLQLIATRDGGFEEILEYLTVNPGSAPLGYAIQAATIDIFGVSRFSARLPSIVFSLVACVAVGSIARLLWRPLMVPAVLVFMILPLQFRYAIEARPYMQGLCFAALSTLFVVLLWRKWTAANAVLYGICVLCGLFSQPFSIFVPLGHALWVLSGSAGPDQRRLRQCIVLSIIAAGTLFVPWFLYVRAAWTASIATFAAQGENFHFNALTILQLFREISGASYWGSAILAIAGVYAMSGRILPRPSKALLLLVVLTPIVGAIVGDAIFNYFVAIRQMIYALPGIAVLAAAGLYELYRSRRALGIGSIAALAIVCVRYDYRWLQKPREDWELATAALSSTPATTCIIPLPKEITKAYVYYDAEFRARLCPPDLSLMKSVVVAKSPYSLEHEETDAMDRLQRGRFKHRSEQTVGGTIIATYVRAGT